MTQHSRGVQRYTCRTQFFPLLTQVLATELGLTGGAVGASSHQVISQTEEYMFEMNGIRAYRIQGRTAKIQETERNWILKQKWEAVTFTDFREEK